MRNLLRVVVVVLVALLDALAVGAAHATSTFDAVFAPRPDRPAVGAPARPHDPTRPTAVVVLGAHGTVVSDALAPYEILAATGAFNLYTVAEQSAPVPLTGGLDVVRTCMFDQLDARLAGGGPQLVVVPAMADTGSPTAAPVTNWLRRTAARGSLLLSVCNGAELLASAGLLDGRRATAHWAALDDYATAYPATTWLRGPRFIEDGADRVTTAGILSGIDGTLRVVERTLGQPAAARAAAAIGWSHWAPGPARSRPPTTRAAADAVALLNAGFAWGAPTYGVALTPGVGELELSSVFETYGGQTLATRTVALTADGGPVVSRHGLVFVPRGAVGSSVAVDRLLVPGTDAAARRVPMPGGVAPGVPARTARLRVRRRADRRGPAPGRRDRAVRGQVDGVPPRPARPDRAVVAVGAAAAGGGAGGGGRGPRDRDHPQARPPDRVDDRGALPDSDRVNRALAVLTSATFVVVLLGLPTSGEPVLAAALGLAFTVLATVGFAAVRRRGRVAGAAYVAVALVLGFAVFVATNAGAGATLMLLIVVVHSVILLPLPAAAVVTALVPLVHVGMSLTDGLREGLAPSSGLCSRPW